MVRRDLQTREQLTEEVPAAVVQASRRNGIVGVGLLAISGFAIHAGVVHWSVEQTSLAVPLVVWTVLASAGLGVTSLMHRTLATAAPRVDLQGDTLVVRYGERVLRASVHDCNVRRGRAGGMRLTGGVVIWSWAAVILIDLPPYQIAWLGGLRCSRGVNTVAVGYSPEMRGRWEQALLAVLNSPHPPVA